jgi:hypothetical protein
MPRPQQLASTKEIWTAVVARGWRKWKAYPFVNCLPSPHQLFLLPSWNDDLMAGDPEAILEHKATFRIKWYWVSRAKRRKKSDSWGFWVWCKPPQGFFMWGGNEPLAYLSYLILFVVGWVWWHKPVIPVLFLLLVFQIGSHAFALTSLRLQCSYSYSACRHT